MKKLLLFLTSYNNPDKDPIAATLAWIAEKRGQYFEVYYDFYHSGKHFNPTSLEDYFGSTVLGGFHHERFYFLNSLFDIEYAIYGLPNMLSPPILDDKSAIIVENKDLFEFYRRIFSHYGLQFPKEAVIVETQHIRIEKESLKRSYKKLLAPLKNHYKEILSSIENLFQILSPYCYPEIFFREALGIGSTFPFDSLSDFHGLSNVYALFLQNQKVEELENQGFNTTVIDGIRSNDTYWSITSRIARRWLNYCSGIAFCDPVLSSYWLPWLCRQRKLTVYELFMDNIRNEIIDLILKTDDKIVYGRQSDDQDITEFSKHDIVFQIVDPGRPLFPVIEEAEYRMLQPKEDYYQSEPDEDILKSLAQERKILCTLLFYCPDLRHVEGLPNILELAALTGIKIGLGLTAQWYKMIPEILEMINVPLGNGGVFPNVEPLLCSAGMGVGVEADGFLKKKTLREHLEHAIRIVSETAGPRSIPKGYYPLLDTIKDYPYSNSVLHCTNKADPLFEIIEESGFEYSISYSSPGKPKILYKSNNFISINHSSKNWHPYSPFMAISKISEIKKNEFTLAIRRKPGWIIAVFDSPLWMYSHYHWKKGIKLLNTITYLLRGGMTGKLINVTPHVISRYARILNNEGFI